MVSLARPEVMNEMNFLINERMVENCFINTLVTLLALV